MKVVNVLARLMRSGAERQLACSSRQWQEAGIESVIVGMADGEHPYAETLEAAGYPVFTVPPARSGRGLIALRRLLQEIRPDIVHIGAESAFDAVALVAIACPSVKGVVRTVHSHFRYQRSLRFRRKIRSSFTRHLGVVWVSVSDEVASTELQYSRNPTMVVEGFVDVNSLLDRATSDEGRRTRAEFEIDPSAFVVGLIGNCAPAKNHELVAEALVFTTQPLQLLHVGHQDGAQQCEIDAWERIPDRHTVHHVGPRDDIHAILASSNLTLIPSRYEGLSNVAIESLCTGVPVISADTTGAQWLRSIPHARCIPHDPTRWGEALDAAVDKPIEVRADVVATLRDRFSPERAIAEYRAIYEQAIDGRLFLRTRSKRENR